MERIIIEIETTNAAFEDSPTSEVARILRDLATRLEGDEFPTETLFDVNGNAVGSVQID